MATEKHLEVVDIGSGHAGYGLEVDLVIGLKPCNKTAVEARSVAKLLEGVV